MEHREPPPLGSSERTLQEPGRALGGRIPFRRLALERAHGHLRSRRARVVALVVITALAVSTYLGYRSATNAVRWLHQQSPYQFSFNRIDLVEPVPGWYRGGNDAFLEQVRRAADATEQLPLLDLTPEWVGIAFKKYAWVDEVTRVTFAPGAIHVRLRYSQPVAWVKPHQGAPQLVDHKGALLPSDQVDPARLGQVPTILGDDTLLPPVDPRPGVHWKKRGSAEASEEEDERVSGAARLAGFLRSKIAAAAPGVRSGALTVAKIMVRPLRPPDGERAGDFQRYGLFLVNNERERAVIWWGAPPGEERPGELIAEEKWKKLQEWARLKDIAAVEATDYWAFSTDGLRVIHGKAAYRPAAGASKRGEAPAPESRADRSG